MKRHLFRKGDVVLFRQIAEGDTAAFRQVFDLYKNRLFGVALKLTKSEAVSEDIVQDVFKALWEGKHNLTHVEDPTSYLFKMTYNRSFKQLKKIARNKILFQTLKEDLQKRAHSVEYQMEAEETGALIQQIIQNLPPRRQLIFKLSRENGLDHKEIAHQLNISPLTVKKQISLALRTIRMHLLNIV